jgi:7,8-dihydroneopterin aldolase/epimerase/oxygenase
MQGRVHIGDLEFDTIVGLLPQERLHLQPLRLNLDLGLDFAQTGRTDVLGADTVDYAQLSSVLMEKVRAAQFETLEALVWQISQFIYETYPQVQSLGIHVVKPLAVPQCRAGVGVSLTSERSEFCSETI